MAGQDQLIRAVVPDVPNELAAICDKSMAPLPADRFQSAHEFQEVLERYLAASDFRVGPKDIGNLVVSAFEDERKRIKTTIEEQVRNVNSDREPINLELVPASLKQTSDSLARVLIPYGSPRSDTPPALQQTGSNTQLSQLVPLRPKSRSLIPALAAGSVLAMGALGAVVYLRGGSSTENRQPSTTSAAKSTDNAPKDVATAVSSPTGSASDTSMINIVVAYPEGARAKLDGGYVEGNPFTARVPKDGSLHKIEIERDGFRSEKRTVTFDKDVDLSIELRAAPGRPFVVARPTTTTKPPATAEATATTPPTKPPEDDPGKKKPKPTVELDEQNPYKKKPQ